MVVGTAFYGDRVDAWCDNVEQWEVGASKTGNLIFKSIFGTFWIGFPGLGIVILGRAFFFCTSNDKTSCWSHLIKDRLTLILSSTCQGCEEKKNDGAEENQSAWNGKCSLRFGNLNAPSELSGQALIYSAERRKGCPMSVRRNWIWITKYYYIKMI